MEKYSTYEVFKNTETGEILRIAFEKDKELEKLAQDEQWEHLDYDPDSE